MVRKNNVRATKKEKVVYAEGFKVRDVIKGIIISEVTLLSLFSLVMFSRVGNWICLNIFMERAR